MKAANVVLSICCCLSAVSAQWLGTINAPPDLRPVSSGAAIATGPPAPSAQFGITVGVVDTVGGTTRDRQFYGPTWRVLVNSASHGVYVLWMYSADTIGSPQPIMRFNYYDRSLRKWVYAESVDFMSRGVDVFRRPSDFGSIDVDTGGTSFVSCVAGLGPLVARGTSGDYSDTTLPEFASLDAPIAVGQDGSVHVFPASTDAGMDYDLVYFRIAPDSWPHWSTPLTGIATSLGWSPHNIAASKVSSKVALVWEASSHRYAYQAYQMQSTDGGLTWDSTSELVPPDAYGGDTLTSYGRQSLFPFYDRHDRFHAVANLVPVVNNTALVVPSQTWHYCPDNSPQWSRIHVASCDPSHMNGSVVDYETYACRPTIGEDRADGLYVVWEQFDSLNVEPTTSRLRADIFMAQDSGDNGASWQPSVRITDQGTWSCHFPSAIDYFEDDTFRVSYIIDQVAGFHPWDPGPASRNPIVVQKIPLPLGIAEGKGPFVRNVELSAAPNPFARATTLSYQLGRAGPVMLTVHDVSGRAVRRLESGPRPVGTYAARWDGRDGRGHSVPAGVYFVRLAAGGRVLTGRLTLVR